MKSILILFGGQSSEHEVSILSARNVSQAIDRTRFTIEYCYIDREGHWWLVDDVDSISSLVKKLYPHLGEGSFGIEDEDRLIKPDVLLPILHGSNGEDGSVQGLAQLLHIPIVGCDMTSSAIGMDKVVSKELASTRGIKIVPYMTHRVEDVELDFHQVSERLGEKVFVKPSRSGSSIGVNKATNNDSLQSALIEAHKHDTVVLVEQAITPIRELEVAVLGTIPNHTASGVGEILFGEEFYSYTDKYSSDSQSSVAIPAQLSNELSNKIQEQALTIFEAIGGSGLARVDFFLSGDEIIFNEINTLPGFTDISMYPKLWEHSGIGYSDLITKLIDSALGAPRT